MATITEESIIRKFSREYEGSFMQLNALFLSTALVMAMAPNSTLRADTFDACTITSDDISLRQVYLQSRYHSMIITSAQAQSQLQQACNYSKLLSQHGVQLTEEMLINESSRID